MKKPPYTHQSLKDGIVDINNDIRRIRDAVRTQEQTKFRLEHEMGKVKGNEELEKAVATQLNGVMTNIAEHQEGIAKKEEQRRDFEKYIMKHELYEEWLEENPEAATA